MNFFESQDRVRKHTVRLVILFALAVISLIVITNLLVMAVFGFINMEQTQRGGSTAMQIDWQTFALVGVGVGLIVLMGSLYKIVALSSAGGKAIAESLGGKLIPRNTDDLQQRKLLNVVDEMAIASGVPSPPVYLLVNELGINAFAAGFSLEDAVIGVTQGTVEHLSRDELQGVIAHEFSHIFNGDMRLNIRLIGVLNGILILGVAGYFILRSAAFSGRGRSNNNGKGAAAIMALGLGLMAIGFAGTFFGGLIKAAVSRQREYLADASAVQFTRNPDSIAGALKRIGGLQFGSKVENPGASEVSHAFFAQGVSGFKSMAATHPPLSERILRIDPQWDGQFSKADTADSSENENKDENKNESSGLADKKSKPSREQVVAALGAVATAAAGVAASASVGSTNGAATSATTTEVSAAIDEIGSPKPESVHYARTLLAELPSAIKEAAGDPYGARALIYALVLDSGQEIRDQQLAHLEQVSDPGVLTLMQKLQAPMQNLDKKFRLPAMDIAIPSLKQLSLDQYQTFRDNLVALIEMDGRVDLLEWSLQKNLFSYLDAHFFGPGPAKNPRYSLAEVRDEVGLVLSVMARAGHQNLQDMQAAFDTATTSLELGQVHLADSNEISLIKLETAFEKLVLLKQQGKQQLLKACAASVAYDKKISTMELELLRAFSRILDCPMPLIAT